MTPTQKRLRDLRDRQSRERGRMAELAIVDDLTDEQRSELDTIEHATPDLERQYVSPKLRGCIMHPILASQCVARP